MCFMINCGFKLKNFFFLEKIFNENFDSVIVVDFMVVNQNFAIYQKFIINKHEK